MIALVSLAGTSAVARDMTDLVYLDYGGFLKGEIKGMELGKLTLDTDEMDVVSINWVHVTSLKSIYGFQIEMEDATLYFGALDLDQESGRLVVSSEGRRDTLDMETIVTITPIGKNLWLRLEGYLNMGFTFTKASDVLQLTLNSLTLYRTRGHAVKFTADIIFNRTEDVTTTQRQDYFLGYQRSLKRDWFAGVAIAPQQNTVMGVQLRTLLGGEIGNNLIQTNHDVLSLSAGIDWIGEESTDPEPTRESWEVLGSLSYTFFQHDYPITNVTANLTGFRSLTISDRSRAEFDATIGRELIKDLNTSLRVYGSYDSDPPAKGVSHNDYGIVLSVGWVY